MQFFNKKVKPDYTPRVEHTTTNKIITPPVVLQTVAPVAPPPPPPAPTKFTPPIVYHEDKKIFPNVITYSSAPILPLTLNQYSVSAPAPDSVIGSGFSPNLETFPTLNNSYFSGGGANSGTGSTGPTGCTGPVGQSGKDSETGATGPMGSTGWTGYTGCTGPKGDAGPSGGELWSTYPATNRVDFAKNDLYNVSTINGTAYYPTSNWSNLPATTTVNMSNNSLNNVSGVNLTTPPDTAVLLTAGAGNVLNVNGVPVGGGGTPETWANYSAIADVVIPDHNLNMTSSTPGVGYTNANINANVVIGNTTQAPLRPDATFYVGSMNIGGLANPVTNMNVYSIGPVNINSATGISVAGGGGVSVSGAGGINILGVGGVALNGGNVEIAGAGGVLINGTGAIVVTSGGIAVNGGGISIAAGGVGITAGGLAITSGTTVIGNSGLSGGGLDIWGSDLNMKSVGSVDAKIHTNYLISDSNQLQISGLSTINGAPYGVGGVTAISTLSAILTGTVTFTSGANVSITTTGNEIAYSVPSATFVQSISCPTGITSGGEVTFSVGAGLTIEAVGNNVTFTNTVAAVGGNGALEVSDGAGNFVGANDLIYTQGDGFTPSNLRIYSDVIPRTSGAMTLGNPLFRFSTIYTNDLVTTSAYIPQLKDGFSTLGSSGTFLGWNVSTNQTQWQTPIIDTPTANRIIVASVNTPTVSSLTWSTGHAANQYVPLAADTSVTYKAPISPATGQTGWRFTKTYTLTTVSVGTLLTIGATYTIVTPANINWTSIGASASTAGTQFTYNGVAITGNNGSVTENSKISWYSRNSLYGLTLPVSTLPSDVFSKFNLRNAWFLVKFNADIAVQGSLAIQIDTYAYQYNFPGPTYPNYTGRWAYSFPLQQSIGFNGAPTTNLTTSTATPRLKAGYTYLLYAGDYSSVGLPGPYYASSSSYQSGGAGLFAPSQTLVGNTLRDPYDIYPEYPHIGLTSCSYIANAIQPPYGGINPYSDPGAVEVASIYLNTSSTAPYSGVGQTVTDFNIMAMGYTTFIKSYTYPMTWV